MVYLSSTLHRKDKSASYSFLPEKLTHSMCQVSLVVKYVLLSDCIEMLFYGRCSMNLHSDHLFINYMTISLKGRVPSLEIKSTNSKSLGCTHYQLYFNTRHANCTLCLLIKAYYYSKPVQDESMLKPTYTQFCFIFNSFQSISRLFVV